MAALAFVHPQHYAGTKACSRCNEAKPYGEFYARRNRKHGLMSTCKACEKERSLTKPASDHYHRNRRAYLDRERERKYGLTREQYDARLREQGGKCAICALPERSLNRRGEVKELAVDHDHATGVVRGLLCTACNCGLGHFSDAPDFLRAAISYLEGGQ